MATLTESSFKNSTVTWSLLLFVISMIVGAVMYHSSELEAQAQEMEDRTKEALTEQEHTMETIHRFEVITLRAESDRARSDRRITRNAEDIQVIYELLDALTKSTSASFHELEVMLQEKIGD